jgi:hypothetical protein
MRYLCKNKCILQIFTQAHPTPIISRLTIGERRKNPPQTVTADERRRSKGKLWYVFSWACMVRTPHEVLIGPCNDNTTVEELWQSGLKIWDVIR